MKRRRRRLLLLAAALQVAGVSIASERPPNILVLYADDHAQAAVGCYGSRIASTPGIDRIAAAGMRFTESFVTNSICGPARAVFLTGVHSHHNGKTTNRSKLRADLPVLPSLLQGAGYHTALIGKWHIQADPVGFDDWSLALGPYYGTRFRSAQGAERRTGHCTDLIAADAVRFLGTRSPGDEEPFFLWVSFRAAHRTWDPPTRHLTAFAGETVPEPATLFDDYAGRSAGAAQAQMRIARDLFPAYDLKLPVTGDGILDDAALRLRAGMTADERAAWDAAYGPENEAFAAAGLAGEALVRWNYQRYIKDYLRCVKGVDDAVGAVLDTLAARGLERETIVLYTSDQGFFLGEHGWYDKRWMYEPSLRTPLIAVWPGVTQPGSTCDALVQNLDLAQTLLEAARAPAPASMQGASLVPLLRGERPEAWRDAIYYHYHQQDAGRTTHTVARHYGVRTQRYKLMFLYDLGEWELYDLERDPEELHNLAADPEHAELRTGLEKRLRELREAYGDTLGGTDSDAPR